MLLVQYLTDNPSHTHIYILPSILLEPNCPLELRLDLHLALVPSYTLAPPTSLATFVLFTFRIYFRKIIDLGRHYRCRRRRMANETNQEQQKLSITFHDLLLKMSSEVQIHKKSCRRYWKWFVLLPANKRKTRGKIKHDIQGLITHHQGSFTK